MPELDAKSAVTIAKRYASEMFSTEGVINLGLEELEYDETRAMWLVTLGFSRTWGGGILELAGARRTYKIISVTDAGEVVSLKNRETADAG